MVTLFFRRREARECVSSLVFLPWYVLDCNSVELGYDVADRVIVPLEERFFDFKLSFDLADNQLGVAFARDLSCA